MHNDAKPAAAPVSAVLVYVVIGAAMFVTDWVFL
jgi:hypothetical protein